ncbi:hypothetical protein C1H46_009305 [Malus baccata]|uniref:Uncharacterized protein n=1 Tax=Malus baccata TaxID=106549 RepID=A0A540N3N1_MALBA|nr:hypothetical protein C1H46_009305 [Malus baccata]
MGLLDQLWDDTLAGPQPDSGLGKLRKHKTFSFRSSSATGSSDGGSVRSLGGNSPEEAKITRSIMIVKPPGYGSANGGSAPVSPAGVSSPISPAGSTPPVSPFSGKHLKWQICLCLIACGTKFPQIVEPPLITDVFGRQGCGGREPFGRFRRRSASDAYEKVSEVVGGRSARSPCDV